jgi:sn-glycerol 3-phosphate transport system substrate-binding protein
MRKPKLLLLITVLSLVLTSVLSACGPSSQADSKGPVNITFWEGTGGQLGQVLLKMVNNFNSSQSAVHVTPVFQQSYDVTGQKLQAAEISGDVPDVVQLNTRIWPAFAQSGALLPLDSYIQSDQSFNINDFEKGLMVDTALNGKQYTLPFNRSTPILYYNKDIIKQLPGVNVNNPAPTWNDLEQDAQEATVTQNGKVQRYGFAASMSGWYFYSLVWSNGGQLLSADNKTALFDQPAAAQGLQLWSNMVNNEKTMMPPTAGTSTSGNAAGDNMSQDFLNGKIAFMIDSTSSLGTYSSAKFNLGTAFLPKFQQYATPTGGANLAILAKTSQAKQDAAWQFIKYMTATQQATYWAEQTGYLPIRVSAEQSPELQAYYKAHPNYTVALNQLQYARGLPAVPQIKQIETDLDNAMSTAVVNKIPAQQELTTTAKQVDQLLQQPQ